MKRAPSALVSIGGFGIAVATLSVATTAAIVILVPQPSVPQTSAAEMITAVRQPTPGFERRIITEPPQGQRMTMLEGLIASELRRSLQDVRVTWPQNAVRATGSIRETSVKTVKAGGALSIPPSFVLVHRGSGRFEMVSQSEPAEVIRKALINSPMPPVTVNVRQRDGRWLSVRPAVPFLAGWQRSVLAALVVSLLLLAPLAWVFARRLTKPFRALAGALGERADTVPQEGPRELREAAAVITEMRNRLGMEAAERMRMLTAIAHDLRTPLTGLRVRIEAAPEPQRTRMVADVERMQAMIGEVLAFARDAASPTELIDVRELLVAIVTEMDGISKVLLLPGDDAWVVAQKPAFRRSVENLVRNAIDYAGGCTITLEQIGDRVIVSVADDGPGIPAADRERLLRPFERGDASRNRETGGAGLGLSIVRDFAAQHNGDFTLSDASKRGTIAAIRLRAARPNRSLGSEMTIFNTIHPSRTFALNS